ncbi:MAG: septation protein A [Pseudomonadota bacterium]
MLKLLLEFGPLVVFFATYKYSDIFFATMLMVGVTAVSLLISYMIDKRLSMPLLISGSVLLISGSITLFSGNPMYIKMKPTIVYSVFCLTLAVGFLYRKPLVKHILGSAFAMEDVHWLTLSKRFALYFLIMAIINEVVWRNYSESFWVNFKVFGAVPITFVFILMQLPFLRRHSTLKLEDRK